MDIQLELDSNPSSTLTLTDIVGLQSIEVAQELYTKHIPSDMAIPEEFWTRYNEQEKLIGLKATLALYVASNSTKTPRQFQLQAVIGLCTKKDVLVQVGTGYGKTICMILAILLHPNNVSLVITPLKKLQDMQVLEFKAYGISALAINQDTPSDAKLWKSIALGEYPALIVQAEQFFITDGHWPRLARQLNNPKFTRKIRFLFVDEVHNVYTAGIDLYGGKAFRPAWGLLSVLRIKLGPKVCAAGLSGTLPEHIKAVVKKHLQLDDDRLLLITLSCNRPNITFATHEVVGQLTDYHNLDFMIRNIATSMSGCRQMKKGIVFHDSIDTAIGAKQFQEELLPSELRGQGIIKTFFSLMSDEYLKKTYDDFRDPDGQCRILHATEAASTGLDVRNIDWVVQYGIPRDMSTMLQRAGRCGRDGVTPAIFLLMFESWAAKTDLHWIEKDEERMRAFRLDPDCPYSGKISDNSRKQERIGISMLKLVQERNVCQRETYARYNNDESADALLFTGPFCCNSNVHAEPFDFSIYFPGQLLYRDESTDITYFGAASDANREIYNAPSGAKRPSPIVASRKRLPVTHRTSLMSRLAKWRYGTWSKEKFKTLRPEYLIVDDAALKTIATAHPDDIVNFHQITLCIGESIEWESKWARSIFEVVQQFDVEVSQLQTERQARIEEQRKRRKVDRKVEQIRSNQSAFQDSTAKCTRVATSTILGQVDLNQARKRLQELQNQNQEANNTFRDEEMENRRQEAVARAQARAKEMADKKRLVH